MPQPKWILSYSFQAFTKLAIWYVEKNALNFCLHFYFIFFCFLFSLYFPLKSVLCCLCHCCVSIQMVGHFQAFYYFLNTVELPNKKKESLFCRQFF